MKISRKKLMLSRIVCVAFIFLVVAAPVFVLAETRSSYLLNFVLENQNSTNGGFYEYKEENSGSDDVTVLATRSSLGILERMGQISHSQIQDNLIRTEDYLTSEITPLISNNRTERLAYVLEALDNIDKIDNIDVLDDVEDYLADCLRTYGSAIGYALDRESTTSASIYGTYFVVKAYSHIDSLSSVPEAGISNYIQSCLDNADVGKGFKSNISSGAVSLENTFFALKTLSILDKISDLDTQTKNEIQDYLETFYVEQTEYTEHYGGYSVFSDAEEPFSTVLATYYATNAQKILYASFVLGDATEEWLLNLQNQEDGGFTDNVLVGQEQKSSTITSYYVVCCLEIDYPNLGVLNSEVWEKNPQWWILAVVIAVIAASVVAGILGYRKRQII